VVIHEPELEVTPGSDATLSCRAAGNVADVDRIQWRREDGELPPGKRWILSTVHVNMHLVIKDYG